MLTWYPYSAASQAISVSIVGDTIREPEEYFFVVLSNNLHANISNGTGNDISVDMIGYDILFINYVVFIYLFACYLSYLYPISIYLSLYHINSCG